MYLGAVAVLDALGFKGIWQRCSPNAVIKRLEDAARVARACQIGFVTNSIVGPDFKSTGMTPIVRLFSDTAIMGLVMKSVADGDAVIVESARRCQNHTIQILVHWVSAFLGKMLEGDPPLIYRGCISTGNLVLENEVFLGPAVDEAAERSQLANGGFVWLAPSAQEWIDWKADSESVALGLDTFNSLAFKYEIPLKNGQHYQTRVVNPLVMLNPTERDEIIQRAIGSFGTKSIEVEIKRQNTEAMLKYAKSNFGS